jgi:hypothetical protein
MAIAFTPTDNRKSGFALILGSIGGLVTMAIHPHGPVPPAQFEHMAAVSALAHSLAMVSFLAMFLGAIGLTLRLASHETAGHQDRLAIAGLVTFGFAAMALLIATTISGFIVPNILRQMIADKANATQWHIASLAVFQFNVAFAGIYSIAASVAMTLWSASAIRNGGLGRFIAAYGCAVPPMLILLILVGHLRLDVHGMAVVVLAHAVWFVVVGVELYRRPENQVPAVPAPIPSN